MIRATLTMKVKAGGEDAFEQAWRTVAAKTQQTPGNLRQTLLRDPKDQSLFVITSDWENQGRQPTGRHERSPEQDELTAPLRALRESASMSVHQLVVHLEKESLQ